MALGCTGLPGSCLPYGRDSWAAWILPPLWPRWLSCLDPASPILWPRWLGCRDTAPLWPRWLACLDSASPMAAMTALPGSCLPYGRDDWAAWILHPYGRDGWAAWILYPYGSDGWAAWILYPYRRDGWAVWILYPFGRDGGLPGSCTTMAAMAGLAGRWRQHARPSIIVYWNERSW